MSRKSILFLFRAAIYRILKDSGRTAYNSCFTVVEQVNKGMKNAFCFTVLAIIFSMTALSGCRSAVISPTITPLPPTVNPSPIPSTLTPSPIPSTLTPLPVPIDLTLLPTLNLPPYIAIVVSPFYNSDGPLIDVGEYSKELGTTNLDELLDVIEEMMENRASLTPEQMYVAAIRLYDNNAKDEAVYWFYEAQFRGRVFSTALDKDLIGGLGSKAFELDKAYIAFLQLSSQYFNGYAGCDLDNWVQIMKTVMDNNKTAPDLESIFPGVSFVPKEEWQTINDEILSGLGKFVDYTEENKASIRLEREALNLDEIFCK